MHTYGLIGKSLRHSWSKQYFDNKFLKEGRDDCRYLLCEGGEAVTDSKTLASWLHRIIEHEHLLGFNVTIPYKQWVFPLLDALSPTAAAIGAVNCVVVQWQSDGSYRLTGHNTDAPAFAATLAPLLQPWHRKSLVLGTGGAARAVTYALQQLNMEVSWVSRDAEAATQRLYERREHQVPSDILTRGIPILSYPEAIQQTTESHLIVNATPVGMYPNEGETPWPAPHMLSPRHLCYDLIYNPTETRFLQQSRQAGAQTRNGLPMLHHQAELSWQLWQATK